MIIKSPYIKRDNLHECSKSHLVVRGLKIIIASINIWCVCLRGGALKQDYGCDGHVSL